jgi:hypothetical protein
MHTEVYERRSRSQHAIYCHILLENWIRYRGREVVMYAAICILIQWCMDTSFGRTGPDILVVMTLEKHKTSMGSEVEIFWCKVMVCGQ